MSHRIRHWCMDCPLTFTDDASANAHHDEVGHKQTFRQQMAYQRGLMPITPDKPIAWMVTARGARFTFHYLDIAQHVRQGFIDEYGADDVADLVPLYAHPASPKPEPCKIAEVMLCESCRQRPRKMIARGNPDGSTTRDFDPLCDDCLGSAAPSTGGRDNG